MAGHLFVLSCLAPAVALDAPLLNWLTARGGTSSVAIATRSNLRGLETTVDAEVGQVLLEVPLNTSWVSGLWDPNRVQTHAMQARQVRRRSFACYFLRDVQLLCGGSLTCHS